MSDFGSPTRLKVLHCPWNIAGQSASLARAERSFGFDSENVVLFETGQGFPADESLAIEGRRLQTEMARYRLLWRAMMWADVVHFSFGQSILSPHPFPRLGTFLPWRPRWWAMLYARILWCADLPLLRAMGKILVVTWQGDDARQGDKSLELFDISIAGESIAGYYGEVSDQWKRKLIQRFSRYAHLQYAVNPDLLHVLPSDARFLPYASFDPRAAVPRFPSATGTALLSIMHAPSHRGAKGTRYILAAIDRLRAEGYRFRFDLVEGLPRSKALARLNDSDVVIDQLLAGWYGGLGLESMSLGKVVVAYIRESDLKFVPPALGKDLPIINANPSNIYDVLKGVLAAPRIKLHACGRAGREFAERYHSPDIVAGVTAKDYLSLAGENGSEAKAGGNVASP